MLPPCLLSPGVLLACSTTRHTNRGRPTEKRLRDFWAKLSNDQKALHQAAREIFDAALSAVDAREAVRRSVSLNNNRLTIEDTELDVSNRTINVIALGKAAIAMAAGLTDVLGDKLTRGIASSTSYEGAPSLDRDRWQIFSGGHPLPTEDSIAAARESVRLLKGFADDAVVVFLVSGGGSAMFELPVDDRITIEDLREANRRLVSCGAAIAEINAVRRTFSAVKGGKLSGFAPMTDQITRSCPTQIPATKRVLRPAALSSCCRRRCRRGSGSLRT